MKRFLPLALLAATAVGCSSETSSEDNLEPTLEVISPAQTFEKIDYSGERLKSLRRRFGADAIKYALQIIGNGSRIKENPQKKHEHLGDLEQKLRERFPLYHQNRGLDDSPRDGKITAREYTREALQRGYL